MSRLTVLMLCLCVTPLALAAPGPGSDVPVLLEVSPAAAPVPALKYQLLPEVAEMHPGNAVPAYLKCFAEQNHFFFAKEAVEERERLTTCPLSDIKPGSLKNYGGHALRQADHAARLEYADWNSLPQIREHGVNFLIPEIQQMRTLARALAVRCRGQIVDGDFAGAVETLKTMFALARHLDEHPTIITGLVGIAIAQTACDRLVELVQQPGAPNLYWALTGLPTPLVTIRKGASVDRKIYEWGFGTLLDRSRPWTADDLPGAIQKVKEFVGAINPPADVQQAGEQWVKDRVQDADWKAAARKGLIEAGYPAGAVGKYLPEQVVVHHLLRKASVRIDDSIKWMAVPYWQAAEGLADLQKEPMDLEDRLAWQMVSAIPKVKAAQARLDQRIALLRTVEAIRLQAAKNGGKLPKSLTELDVPAPTDPATGKAFAYKVDGMTALLSGEPLPAGQKSVQLRYELRLRK